MRLAFQFCINYRWILNCMLQIFVRSIKRHWFTIILHFLFIHKNFSGSFFEKVHFSSSKIKLIVIIFFFFLLWSLIMSIILLLLVVALVFFLDSIFILTNRCLSEEETIFLHLLILVHLVLFFLRHKSHLLMIWRSKNFFVLGFFS